MITRSKNDFEKLSESLNLNFKGCLPPLCNRLPVTKFLKFKLQRHDSSIINYVIDYQRSIIDYQWGNFKNNSEESHLFMSFWKAIEGLYICDLFSKIFKVFQNFIVLFSQTKTFGQTLAKQLRIFLSSLSCIILLLKREKHLLYFKSKLLL